MNPAPQLSESNRARSASFLAFRLAVGVYATFRAYSLWFVASRAEAALVALSLCMELMLVMAAWKVMQAMTLQRPRHAEANEAINFWEARGEAPPRVDVLIPSYNESAALLERTIVGALRQDYAQFGVWVLDDGRRDWLKQLCAELGAGYLTRTENRAGKPGNLNAALHTLEGRGVDLHLLAVVDADFVLEERFLQRTVALLKDEAVALVQTPQYFYNLDNFQSSLAAGARVPDALRFSHDVLLPARDAAEAAYCVGTSFVVRKSAIARLGGFPEESVADDIWLSFRLRQAGFRIAYLAELLSFGVATEGLAEYLQQRARWATGYAQIVLLQWRITTGRSLWKRLQSAEGYLRFIYTAIARLLFVSLPAAYWWLGLAPVRSASWLALSCYLSMLATHRGFLFWASRGRQLPFYWDAASLIGWLAQARGAARGFSKPKSARFVVTAKGASVGRLRVHWGTLSWVGSLITLLGLGLALDPRRPPPGTPRPELVAMCVWTVLALITLLICCFFCVEAPERRAEPRFDGRRRWLQWRIRGGASESWAQLLDVSSSSARLRFAVAQAPDTPLELELCGRWYRGRTESQRAARTGNDPAHDVLVRFELEARERQTLLATVYSAAFVNPVREGSLLELARGLLLRLVVGRRARLNRPPRAFALD